MSGEIQRILSLPVNEHPPLDELVEGFTEAMRAEGGEWSFRPHQALALFYAWSYGGGFLPIDVGGGKTLLAFAIPKVLEVDPDECLVLAPAGLAREAEIEYDLYREHFDLDFVRYVSHAKFSQRSFIDELYEIRPSVIIIDEAQTFCGSGVSARKSLLKRYLRDYPETKLFAMTATFASDSIEEYAWLIEACLGSWSPVPSAYSTRQILASFVDANSLGGPKTDDLWQLGDWLDDPRFAVKAETLVERVRGAYRNRFISAPGVVVTEGSSCDAEIVLFVNQFGRDDEIDAIADAIRTSWQTPSGEWIDDPLALNRKTREASQGFTYYWDWPGGKPDLEWLYARNEYASAVARITRQGSPELATRSRVDEAVDEGQFGGDDIEELREAWLEVAHRPEPPTLPDWHTDSFLASTELCAKDLVEQGRRVIIWYEHRAVASRLADRGLRVCVAGDEVPRDGELICLSIASHGTGLNLQAWDTNIVMCSPSNMGRWQQLVGRTHRAGQESEEVWVIIALHTPEMESAWTNAQAKALAYQENHGIPQKILSGLVGDRETH